jgi:hypothetical protein
MSDKSKRRRPLHGSGSMKATNAAATTPPTFADMNAAQLAREWKRETISRCGLAYWIASVCGATVAEAQAWIDARPKMREVLGG